jgi:hypothetical protein
MARDVFVYFAPEHKPSVEGVGNELRQYFGNLAKLISLAEDQPRWLVDLPGRPEGRPGLTAQDLYDSRWVEVFVGGDYIDVITRDMDEITNAIARGFAERCARKWKGRLET